MSHKNISIYPREFVLKTSFNLQKLVINLRSSRSKRFEETVESSGQGYLDRSSRGGETWVDPGE